MRHIHVNSYGCEYVRIHIAFPFVYGIISLNKP